jgi:hypothetical protein
VPSSVVQAASGANNTPASSTQTAVLTSSATAGNQILLAIGADDYASTPPSGFTQHTGCAQQTFLGHYLWRKTATGGEKTVSYTLGAAAPSCWIVAEVSGIDSASPYDTSTGLFEQVSGNSYSTPSLTPTAGTRLLVATIGGSLSSAFTTGMGSWTNGFTEQGDVWTTISGTGTRDNIGLAILEVAANGSTGYTAGATFETTTQAHTGIIMSLRVGSAPPADTAPPPASFYRRRLPLLVR